MKKEHNELAEVLVIGGVLLLLLCCIIAEIWRGPEVNLDQVINGLTIILTGVSGHLFGKNAGLQQPKADKPTT